MGDDCFHEIFGLSGKRITGMIQKIKVGFSTVELIKYRQIMGYVKTGEPKSEFIRLSMDFVHESFAYALYGCQMKNMLADNNVGATVVD